MEEARDRNDDEPETPRTSLNYSRPMLTPPRLVQVATQNRNQNEGDEADMQQTTSHQINVDDVIQLERDSERLHIPQNENSSSTIVFNTQTPSELNFPNMRQSISSSSTSTGISQVTSPSDWNMSLNRETVRRGRRRRASSFDNSIPIPRISLRPRFSRHSDNANNSNVPGNEPGSQQSSQSNIINGESLLYSNFAAHGDGCNCAQCASNRLPSFDVTAHRHPSGARIRPRNRRHFRHNTYGGSDASTDVFAEALQGDSLDNFSFALSPQFENIDLSNHSSSSTNNDQSNGVVSIVHNPFELSAIEASLPPAAMAFAPPSDVNSTSTRVGRNPSQQASSSSTTASTVIPRPIPRPQPPLADSHPIPHPLLGHTRSKAQVASTTNVNHSTAATSTASPSLGTPTCTCTISTSSVSAFDQTSPPQWQDHNFSPGTSSDSMVFEGLKNEPSPPPKTTTSFNPMCTIQSGVNAPSTTQLKNDDTQILTLDRDTKRDGNSESISVDNNTKENASNFPFDEVIFHDNSSDHSTQLPYDEYAEKKKDST